MPNSGKTSILEGINLFYSQRKINYLGEILNNRGEYIIEGSEDEFDIRHLFYGHEVNLKSEFSITGLENESFKKLIVSGSRQVCVYCKIEEERRRQKNVTEKSERNSRG